MIAAWAPDEHVVADVKASVENPGDVHTGHYKKGQIPEEVTNG
jgi:hypothetical protein